MYTSERWKTPIKMKLYMTIGLVSGSLLLQTVAIVIHSVSKQKLFVVIINVFAIGLGAVGGTLQNVFKQHSSKPF